MTDESNNTTTSVQVQTSRPPGAVMWAAVGKAWSKALAGPAISAMVVLVIAVLAGWITWGYKWTALSEVQRVNFIGGIGVILVVVLGIVYLALEAGIKVQGLGLKVGNFIQADVTTDDDKPQTKGDQP